jgi:hypothetical protein
VQSITLGLRGKESYCIHDAKARHSPTSIFEEEKAQQTATNGLTRDEARRVALTASVRDFLTHAAIEALENCP